MYENLTNLLPLLQNDTSGEWSVDKTNNGAPGRSIQLAHVYYTGTIIKLEDEVYRFVDRHPDYLLKDRSISPKTPVYELDAKAVITLLFQAVRGERFCEGTLFSLCENGSIVKWLKRLKELDKT